MLANLLLLSLLTISIDAPEASTRVTIPTESGGVLTGQFASAGPGAPAVLFFPMCREEATNGWAPVADQLVAAGISSLSITYRGYGDSTSGGPGDHRTSDAEAALAYLRAHTGAAALAVAGSSCGVHLALSTAARHPEAIRAAVALTGPHIAKHVDFIKATPSLAVFSGASLEDAPAPDWARELKAASTNSASRLALVDGKAHGTDIFHLNRTLAADIAGWLAARLT